MKIINQKLYNELTHFIDLSISFNKKQYDELIFISYGNEQDQRWKISFFQTGLFIPSHKIIIHRFNLNAPNISYLDEVITILHEYGHYLSLKNGEQPNKSETDYNFVETSQRHWDNLHKQILFNEECNAWKYAFKTIWLLPSPFLIKIAINIGMVYRCCSALYGYDLYVQGIID